MGRGRTIDKTLPLTRSLTAQRDYRARKSAHLKNLEETIVRLTAENDALRAEVAELCERLTRSPNSSGGGATPLDAVAAAREQVVNALQALDSLMAPATCSNASTTRGPSPRACCPPPPPQPGPSRHPSTSNVRGRDDDRGCGFDPGRRMSSSPIGGRSWEQRGGQIENGHRMDDYEYRPASPRPCPPPPSSSSSSSRHHEHPAPPGSARKHTQSFPLGNVPTSAPLAPTAAGSSSTSSVAVDAATATAGLDPSECCFGLFDCTNPLNIAMSDMRSEGVAGTGAGTQSITAAGPQTRLIGSEQRPVPSKPPALTADTDGFTGPTAAGAFTSPAGPDGITRALCPMADI